MKVCTQLIAKGIHVFVDKPLGLDFEGAQKVVELAREKGVVFQVGFNRRFAPANVRVKKDVDAGEEPGLVIMQKNRRKWLQDPRDVIFDGT